MKMNTLTRTGKLFLSVLLIVLSSFTLLIGAKREGIDTITKPYLGEYYAEKMLMDGKDLMPKFAYMKLELKEDNTFLLTAKGKSGRKKQMKGEYSFDGEEGKIVLEKKSYFGVKRGKFLLKDGKIHILSRYGKHTLYMVFARL